MRGGGTYLVDDVLAHHVDVVLQLGRDGHDGGALSDGACAADRDSQNLSDATHKKRIYGEEVGQAICETKTAECYFQSVRKVSTVATVRLPMNVAESLLLSWSASVQINRAGPSPSQVSSMPPNRECGKADLNLIHSLFQ